MPHELITVDTPAGPAETYVSRPGAGSGPVPGVLFLMDAIGIRPRLYEMADTIAGWGYVVLMPNVFFRDGTIADLAPTTDLTVDGNRDAFFASGVTDRVRGLTPEVAGPDVDAYVDALATLPGVTRGPIAVTGYCMGGRLAVLAASRRPERVAGIGLFHTGRLVTDRATSPHRLLDSVTAEVVALHADDDPSLPPEAVAGFDDSLTAAGLTHITSVHPGAAHGYTMADTSMYHPEADAAHRDLLRDLLSRTLA